VLLKDLNIRRNTMNSKIIWACVLIVAISTTLTVWFFFQPQTAQNDFSRFSWTQAFDKLYHKMAEEYAFTEWKGIDWEELYGRYRPVIEKHNLTTNFDSLITWRSTDF